MKIVEQLIFIILAFVFFINIFYKMIKENDTNYVGILILGAIGIALNFIEVFAKTNLGIVITMLKYIVAILIPVSVIILEKKEIPLIQVLNVLKAKIYLKIGNNKKAKEQLIKLVTKYPTNYIGHKMLAEIYELEGGMRKAIDEYVQAIDANKKDYDSYFKIAELLNNLQKQDEAKEMLFSLLSKKPEYYKATELLGEILIEKEMYKEVANIYQDALKYHPMDYDINYNLGLVYTMLNDFKSAKICYEKAAEINSLCYHSKYYLAQIALIFKEIDEAEKYFIEAIEDEELSAESYFQLSKISMMKGDKENAIKYAKIAIDIDASKVVPKIKKDPIFIPVIAKIPMPFNFEIKDYKTIFTEKELKAKNHLDDMFEITSSLSYDDIGLLKKEAQQNYEKFIEQDDFYNENQRDF